ncbi:A-kinase anchor protein 4 [Canis lupus baileyi]|nr:A-kinase anchor protein 4 [Canis lupus familiaris]XP_025324420.1 A-kinase anchor protein 4 [Canis lupus dingo]XP_025324421.1 A-kinase anchor protein 4 [Canis lupus dingo]XP_038305947.1 A-kinase anchor protein 4 [Canis lupus familiaris]XP_038305948.1 A-kinase anchor protein 4 [Canis lupus familiaris]XP_038443379.1 A-kinase anchor protein 4 [Canis lupus familiaris]XP_038443380.1 A-kinase anchor protein 4 [Canis lupus familiaris]XP_851545.1 A-kinase anchor protein 4 [Canis lupus familiaris]|eukprot:XP_005641411.1 A-kinase anchor protein 4 [Canis lupus familiaris]
MSDDIDWLHSRRGVCKVDLYSPTGQQDQDRKVICFVDVSTLNVEDKDSKDAAGSSSEGDLNLGNLEEKEIIVIKDTEKQDQSKTEGSVCLFKQAPSDPISVLNWLLNDLQKYALGFQHALSPSTSSCKHKVGDTDGEYHKIPSGNCYSVYADQVNMDYMANGPQSLRLEITAAKNTNNNQSPSTPPAKSPSSQRAVISPDGECSMDDLSFYVNRLSSLVIQMARKEIKEKLEGGSKCLHHSIYPSPGDKGKNSPRSPVSKIASEMAHDAVELTSAEMRGTGEECKEGGRKTFLYSELSNKNKSGDKQMCQRDSKEFADCISKGLMVYANQVASDMMVSVMKTLKIHSSGKPIPACVVLKRVLLKHTKEIVSDLIDSCLKNLHNITGVLMTDSDFVSAVKRNLFNHGKQNAADIMEAMLKRLVSALLGEKKETKCQSLSYASLKAGSHDPKCKNQSLEFSAVKAEMKGKDKGKMKPEQCKSLTSAEKVGEHILKESLTMWNQKQGNQGKMPGKVCANKEEKREKISPSTDSLAKDLIVSALTLIQYHLTQQAKGKDACEEDCPGSTTGYMTQSAQYEKCGSGQSAKALSMKHLESHGAPGPSTSLKDNQQLDSQKLDMSNIVLMLIQKLLSESPFNCDDLCESENKRSEPRTNKAASMSKKSDRGEEQCQDNQELDFISGMKQVNRQFIDQLVESVMKLCLIMAKYSNNGAALAELEEQAALANNPNYQVGGSRCSQDGAMSQNHQDSPGPEVIVNNQCSTSSLQKQLQAVLQWIAASQFNVPMLYFMGDDDGQLEKLPEVSAKAAEKGYSVGDLLQEVMKFAKERQLDEAVGNMARKQLLDWLLTNL